MRATDPMTIAVLGAGHIGGTLGAAFARAGHAVTLGVRDPSSPAAAAALGSGVRISGVAEALQGAEVALLAVPGRAVDALVREHAAALAGLLVVDASNSMGGGGPADSHDAVLAAVPTARYARAFNSLGWENFAEPRFGATVADLFFSSAEDDRATVEALIEAVGLRPAYLGPDQHEVVDGVLRLWFALAIGQGRGRHLAFRVLDADDR